MIRVPRIHLGLEISKFTRIHVAHPTFQFCFHYMRSSTFDRHVSTVAPVKKEISLENPTTVTSDCSPITTSKFLEWIDRAKKLDVHTAVGYLEQELHLFSPNSVNLDAQEILSRKNAGSQLPFSLMMFLGKRLKQKFQDSVKSKEPNSFIEWLLDMMIICANRHIIPYWIVSQSVTVLSVERSPLWTSVQTKYPWLISATMQSAYGHKSFNPPINGIPWKVTHMFSNPVAQRILGSLMHEGYHIEDNFLHPEFYEHLLEEFHAINRNRSNLINNCQSTEHAAENLLNSSSQRKLELFPQMRFDGSESYYPSFASLSQWFTTNLLYKLNEHMDSFKAKESHKYKYWHRPLKLEVCEPSHLIWIPSDQKSRFQIFKEKHSSEHRAFVSIFYLSSSTTKKQLQAGEANEQSENGGLRLYLKGQGKEFRMLDATSKGNRLVCFWTGNDRFSISFDHG